MKFYLLAFGLVFVSLATIGASIERFDPVDDSKADPSFVAFKSELKVAIQKKNAAFINKILSEDVEYSFGADPERKSAVDGFVRHYRINDRKGSSFWESLREVVDLGCTKSDKDFVCCLDQSESPNQGKARFIRGGVEICWLRNSKAGS